MSKYESTQDQMNKEVESMVNRLKDPDEHEKKRLADNHKQNVERTTKRYGLD